MKSTPSRSRVLWIVHAGFFVIVLISWLSEYLRIPYLVFGESFAPNWGRALIRSLIVISIWSIVYIEIRRILRRLHHLEDFLLVCSWCRRIGDHGTWHTMEKFFGSRFQTRTTHGLCPDCSDKMMAQAAATRAPRTADPAS